ncbi:MAG: acyloxyacyl hydrolase [Rhodospirillales bacterium]
MSTYRKRFGAAVLGIACFAASTVFAAPIYDMRQMLGETHPFLQAPPAAPSPSMSDPAVPVLRPNEPSAAQPRSGSGPMMMPGTLREPAAGQGRRGGQTPGAAMPASEPMPAASKPFISEIRIGALAHDQGPFSSNKEDGYDANFEILFSSPSFLDIIWSPRPHIGATYNAYGDTSQAYLGLTWEWDFWQDFFAGFSLGGAIHNGKTSTLSLDKKELGCRVLFRESITFGYRINKTHSLMAFMDHISNAKLCSSNEGLENVGIRYGYRF